MFEFRKILTIWYKENCRNLPWRETADPYLIWVSEIILQQTRVDQGTEYYKRFVSAFPDVESLAGADEEDVLKLWQGLGYYSRARNLLHAAKQVVTLYSGQFPKDYHEIRKLKGVGDYTAAAIASIAFDLPHAVVDGNVYRVLSRLFGIATPIDSPKGKKEFAELAQQLIEGEDPAIFNQAMMEFGALQCLPRNPDCANCPLAAKCYANLHQQIDKLPVKSKQMVQKNRFLNYLVVETDGHFYLEKRGRGDIWANLYQFPLLETTHEESVEQILQSDNWLDFFEGKSIAIDSVSNSLIHQLTHQKLNIRFWNISTDKIMENDKYLIINKYEIHKYPVPKPIENYLRKIGLNIPPK